MKLKNLFRSSEPNTGYATSVDYGENTHFVYFTVRYFDKDCSADCVILDEGEMDKLVAEWTALRSKAQEAA